MEISTNDWHLLAEDQLKEIKNKIDDVYETALDTILLREASTRLARFEDIVEGSVLLVALDSVPDYAVVTGKARRGLGFRCWFFDGNVRDVALSSIISHEVTALLTPLSSMDKTPLPEAIIALKSKYQEDVFE